MLIDGKGISDSFRKNIKREVETLAREGVQPSLSVILVGKDEASQIYVRNKERACKEVGIISNTYRLPDAATTYDLIELIDILNSDKRTHGILVQVPLPEQIDQAAVLSRVSPKKDVDGFHKLNVAALYLGEDCFYPCTANGVIQLIESTGERIEGKHAVILGRSNIVGKPLIHLMLQNNATITVCHSRTKDIKDIAKTADILVSAIGKKSFVTSDMVKPGAIVIDVGISRVDGKVFGDVDFEAVSKVASHITPVPGGVGPMTITNLLSNTVKAARGI